MEMDTITMPKQEARAAFLDYRRAVRQRHNAEDEMIMRGYRALSQGKQVINLLDVMKAGGIDQLGRPRLAISRADEECIEMRRSQDGRVSFAPSRLSWRNTRRRVAFPAQTLETPAVWEWRNSTAEAIVPIIPPRLRPAHDLANYHILWEAEWSRVPPKDPALLKHAGGWLYVVLAVWDLTPLEQAVLGLTRN